VIDSAESAVRVAGAVGLVVAWATAGWGAARAASQAPGRGAGLAPRIHALGAYALVGIPYAVVCVLLWRRLPIGLSPTLRIAALAAGATLGAAGLGLYLWGRLSLGDMYNVSSGLGSELFASHRLVTSGPYRIVRHPMYAGLIAGAFGALLVYRTWTTVFVVAALPGAVRKAHEEERLLAEEFGDAYESYRRLVPRWWPRLRVRSTRSSSEAAAPTMEGGS